MTIVVIGTLRVKRQLKRYSIFKITRVGSMITKEVKYLLSEVGTMEAQKNENAYTMSPCFSLKKRGTKI